MPTTEHTINDALAEVLRKTRHAWRYSDIVRSENTGMLRESAGRPDILVIETSASPVAIEVEVLPANSVESDAISRLGQHVTTTGQAILSSIAIRLSVRLRSMNWELLRNAIASAGDLEMAVESFELFRRIATDAMTTLDLPPNHPTPSPSAPSLTAPDASAPTASARP